MIVKLSKAPTGEVTHDDFTGLLREGCRRTVVFRGPVYVAAQGVEPVFKNRRDRIRELEGLSPWHYGVPPARFTDWVRPAQSVSFYIDESVPDESGEIEGFAVVAVRNKEISASTAPLRFVDDHLKDDFGSFDKAFAELVRCDDARLVTLPVVSGNVRNYDALLKVTVELCLGWLFNCRDSKRRSAAFHIDRYSGHPACSDAAGLYQQVIAGDPRMAGWRIEEFQWVDADGAHRGKTYVPYADAVAYLLHRTSEYSAMLRQRYRLNDWHGYIPVWSELIDQLRALDAVGESAPSVLLDLASHLTGTEFWSGVLAEWRPRIQQNGSSVDRLLDALDERFRSKSRNLGDLARQLRTVDDLVGNQTIGKRPRGALLQALMHLRSANHAGDPEASQRYAKLYEGVKASVFENDRNLATWCELNIAVAEADAFDYDRALNRIHDLIETGFADKVEKRERGQLYSAYGQYLSMAQDWAGADEAFVRALDEFTSLWSSEETKAGEIEQTRVYRTINSMDRLLARDEGFAFADFRRVLVELVGDIASAAKRIARDDGAGSPFVQHALLRALWLLPELSAFTTDCLDSPVWAKDPARSGTLQHPWEMIWMYRGLLSSAAGADHEPRSRACFDRALDIVAAHEGMTFRMVGTMIAACAACRFPDAEYAARGIAMLEKISSKMSGAQRPLRCLREILSNPLPERTNEALTLLPFNYH